MSKLKVYAGAQDAYNKAIASIDNHIAVGLPMPESVVKKTMKSVETAYLTGLRRRHKDATVAGFREVLATLQAKLAECDIKPRAVKLDPFADSLAGLTADAVAAATELSAIRLEADTEGDEGDEGDA